MLKLFIQKLKWLFVLFVGLLILGFLYEQFSRYRLNKNRPDESNFIEIDGRKLHFHKQGNHANGTVFFESGMGAEYSHWQDVQPELAKHYTTISYDRAGILWSDVAKEKTIHSASADLATLLRETNCPKPYYLVAHSLGGVTIRPFVKDNQDDIGGIVLVDCSHPLQLKKSSEKLLSSFPKPPFWLIRALNEVGVLRIMYHLQPMNADVPKDHWFNTNVRDYFYRIIPGFLQEWENDTVMLQQAEAYDDFGEIPLVVITGAYPNGNFLIKDKEIETEYLTLHHELQRDLLNLSSNSKQVMAEQSGHYIALQEPELIVKEVLSIPSSQKNKLKLN